MSTNRTCKRCGTDLNLHGYCRDLTCPFSDHNAGILHSKWQWMSNTFGPMGWFTDKDKVKYEGTAEFSDGHWRPISPEELAAANRDIGRLTYEQS